MLNFDHSTVKHALQMIATSGFLTALECTKFAFGRGSVPDNAGGAYSAPVDSLAGLRGTTLLREGEEGRGDAPLTRIPGSAPDIASATHINTCMVPWVRVSLPPKRHLDRFIRFCRVHPFVLHTYHGMFDIESNNHTYAMRAIRIILRQRHFTVFNNYHCWPL